MTDRDEELDLDRPEVTKVLLGDAAIPKKKGKGKGKAKKSKEDGEVKTSAKGQAALPLSMQGQTSEDAAMFEAKFGSLKGAAAKDTKPYNTADRYKSGDVINHKKFGVGFVVAESGSNKIEVLFKAGRKLLITAPAKTTNLLKSLQNPAPTQAK